MLAHEIAPMWFRSRKLSLPYEGLGRFSQATRERSITSDECEYPKLRQNLHAVWIVSNLQAASWWGFTTGNAAV